MIKLISFFLSALMSVSILPMNFAQSIFSAITGVPYAESSINEEFTDNIDSSDVKLTDESSGYYKNMIMLFIDDGANVFEKYNILKKYNLTLLGWCCWADMYIARCSETTSAQIESLGNKIMSETSQVSYAGFIPFTKSSPDLTPNDPFDDVYWDESRPAGSNWYLEAIEARGAWNYSEYFSKVKVGIVDNGFNVNHEDLKGKIKFPSKKDENRNITAYHGTCVAGIVGAKQNNKLGGSGINDKAELLCVDWEPEDSQNWNTTIHIFFGTCKLIKAGAKVVNLSIGTSVNINMKTADSEKNAFAMIYSATISVLIAKGYDFLVVQSAGNGNKDGNAIDASYNGHFCALTKDNCISIRPGVKKQDVLDHVLIVGAVYYKSTEKRYCFTQFSNTGEVVEICAPGRAVYGPSDEDNGYFYMSGTSSAAPIVTGVASLVWSVNPSLTAPQVKKILISSVNHYATSDYEEADRQYPVVNAKLAVEAALQTKYKMTRITGKIDKSCNVENDDCVNITVNEKNKIITAPNGNIDLLIENGNVKMEIIGNYAENETAQVSFSAEGEDVDLGNISPVTTE